MIRDTKARLSNLARQISEMQLPSFLIIVTLQFDLLSSFFSARCVVMYVRSNNCSHSFFLDWWIGARADQSISSRLLLNIIPSFHHIYMTCHLPGRTEEKTWARRGNAPPPTSPQALPHQKPTPAPPHLGPERSTTLRIASRSAPPFASCPRGPRSAAPTPVRCTIPSFPTTRPTTMTTTARVWTAATVMEKISRMPRRPIGSRRTCLWKPASGSRWSTRPIA